ncbi:MAG: DUF4192 domain-containing protein [Actinomycetia bacterium]|nr:DUF4192 domain-containing protein [Actinomycetes bacterium]
MTNTSDPPHVSLSRLTDVLAVVPYLLGFHPHESIVIVACRERRVEFTARFDLGLCDDRPQLRARLRHLHDPDRRFIVVAYSDDKADAAAALRKVEALFAPGQVLVTFRTDGQRIWLPGHARPLAVGSSPDALSRILRRRVPAPLTRRDDLAALVAGPSPVMMTPASLHCADAMAAVTAMSHDERLDVTTDLVRRGRPYPMDLTDAEAALLACLMQEEPARLVALCPMTRQNAPEHVRLWLRVLDAICPAVATPVLGMAGLAAWAAGEGALLVCCLERALNLDPANKLIRLLDEINRRGLPPAAWDAVAPTLTCHEPEPVG